MARWLTEERLAQPARRATLVALAALAACGKDDGPAPAPAPAPAPEPEPEPAVFCEAPPPPAEATLPIGASGDLVVLMGGRRITPAGTLTDLGPGFAADVLPHPTAPVAYVSDSGLDHPRLHVVARGGGVVQDVDLPGAFAGLALSADGSELFAALAEAGTVGRFDVDADGLLTPAGSYDLQADFASGLALSDDGATLYAGTLFGRTVLPIDLATDVVGAPIELSGPAAMLAVVPGRQELYVTAYGSAKVAVVDLVLGEEVDTVEAQKNPFGLAAAADGGAVYVAVTDGDEVLAIDTDTRTVAMSIPVGEPGPDGEFVAASPVDVAIGADGRLYVPLATYNSVLVLDPTSLAPLGAVPTAWYPSAVAIGADGALWIADAKGVGSGPNLDPENEYGPLAMRGAAQAVDAADLDDAALAAGATAVADDNRAPIDGYPFDCADSFPVPTEVGGATPIEHVVLVVRENKTYDALLGDLGVGNGDPSLELFGPDVTPNLHALVGRFAHHDNFYNDSEVSLQGHLWLTSSFVTDYVERAWLTYDTSFYAGTALPTGQPDYNLFTHLLHHGVDFRNYGEGVGLFASVDGLLVSDQTDLNYPGVLFNLDVSDVERVEYLRDQWITQGRFPTFSYVLLPRDHTYGTSSGQLTPESMIADNDEATGRLVEMLSHSDYWPTTAVFVLEDDPQTGRDHVDYHRSILLVASPWAKRGYISHVNTSFPSVLRTIELILGVPPMNRLDAEAVPLWDAFASEPDLEPFTARAREIPDAVNARGAPGQALSDRMDFRFPDLAPELGDIVWWARRGEPPPGSPVAEIAAGARPALREVEDEDEDAFAEVLEELEERFPDAYRRWQGR